MDALSAAFQSGLIADVIIGLMVAEWLMLAALHWWYDVGPDPRRLVANFLAGLCLVLALRAALTGASWSWLAVWLGAALLAHVADLAQRWRG